jgi:hypothetical protein
MAQAALVTPLAPLRLNIQTIRPELGTSTTVRRKERTGLIAPSVFPTSAAVPRDRNRQPRHLPLRLLIRLQHDPVLFLFRYELNSPTSSEPH